MLFISGKPGIKEIYPNDKAALLCQPEDLLIIYTMNSVIT